VREKETLNEDADPPYRKAWPVPEGGWKPAVEINIDEILRRAKEGR
jgi:hypothetical protein